MAAAATHALVEGDLTARLVDDLRQRRVVLLGEVGLARVRSPQQPAHVHTASSSVCEDATYLGARSGEALVAVALPIREEHTVVACERRQCLVQATEILAAVDEHVDAVAFGPSSAVTVSTVDRARLVPPLAWREEPVIEPQ